jgi:hypothetical protein
VSPVKYELGFYIPEDDILHGHCRENIKSYIALTGWTGHVAGCGKKKHSLRKLVVKAEGKRPLGRPNCRLTANIKTDL